jgi:hypothetical protein
MAKSSNQPESSEGGGGRYRLELVGLTSLADRPGITIQAVGARNDVLSSQKVDQEGNFALPADVLRRAAHVVVGASDDKDGVKREGALRFSTEDFRAQTNNGVLALAEPVWSGWRYYWTCVSGSVRVCRRRPRWFDDLIQASAQVCHSPHCRTFSAGTTVRLSQTSLGWS